MKKISKTIIQAKADSAVSGHELLSELHDRMTIGLLTMPPAEVADVQRQQAYLSLSRLVRGIKQLPKLMVKADWCLVGGAAAITHGSTRLTDNVDVLIGGDIDTYRDVELMLAQSEWEPIFVDACRTKYHPAFVVRSWWFKGDAPKNIKTDACRRLNLVSATDKVQDRAFSSIKQEAFALARDWMACSVEVLFAMKIFLGRAVDIADMIEIIQGGSSINWRIVRDIMERANLGGLEMFQKLSEIGQKLSE